MKHKRITRFLAIFAVVVGAFVFSNPSSVSAIDATDLNTITSCETSQKGVFTGSLFTLPDGDYDVFVKLAKRGQLATITAAAQYYSQEGKCTTIGKVNASGDEWTRVGVWNQISVDESAVFQISSDQLGTSLDANRPSLMLLPKEDPACVPTDECHVTLDGQKGYVLPPGSLNTTESLHIVRVVSPESDTISKVVYYVDDEPAYTTKTLSDFDLRYVTYSNQTLSRVIEYTSGQRVVLESLPPAGFSDNFGNFVFRTVNNNPTALIVGVVIVGIVLVGGIIYGVWRGIRRHHHWRIAHGFETEVHAQKSVAEQENAFKRTQTLKIVKRSIAAAGGAVGLFAIIVLVDSFAVTLFKVDGHSMESTYFTDNEMLINKAPVTWAHTRGVQYTPNRGEVVILRPVYGVVDPQTADLETTYIIKRVIGLPGERVIVKDGKVTVFNKEYPEGFNPDQGSSWQKTIHTNDPLENVDVTLGSDELFISGDNRPESVDSRFNGPISTRQVVGIIVAKLW